jgi:pilus assembly protein CpaF
MTGLNIPNEAVRRYISSAIHVIIHISRLVDGSRKVVSFQEITGMEGNMVTMQEIFAFEQTGIDESGRVKGRFAMKGFLPKFMERFAVLGVPIPYNIFDSNKAYEI